MINDAVVSLDGRRWVMVMVVMMTLMMWDVDA